MAATFKSTHTQTGGHFDFNRTNDFKLFGNYAIPIGRGQQFGSSLPGWANEVIGGLALNAKPPLSQRTSFHSFLRRVRIG